MKFVVTGAGGFLGSNLSCRLLTSTEHEVVAVTSQPREQLQKKLVQVDQRVESLLDRLAIISPAELLTSDVLRQADVVINGGFPWNRGGVALAEGLKYQQELFTVAGQVGVPTFINISSQSVYSPDRDEPAHEGSPVDCHSPYATAKYAQELLAQSLIAPKNLINVRLGSLIGPGYDVRIVNRFVKEALAGNPITVVGGDQQFAYLDVRDAAEALILIGEAGVKSGASPLNLGSNQLVSLNDIASTVAEEVFSATGVTSRIETVPAEEPSKSAYALDMTKVADIYSLPEQRTMHDSVANILQEQLRLR